MSSSALADGLRHLRCQLAAQRTNEDSDEQLLHAFTSRRDEAAFAVLMRRHGPMVLHVCRRVLRHEQDAEDALQATFLVLAQRAAVLRNKTSLASFLHGIAYRTALKAKQSAVRRLKYEGQAPSRSSVDPADELSWREVRELLDKEIGCLPEIYRSVFILCVLEGSSREEAARRLGLKEGTVSSRLTAARKLLAQRLARRGIELTAALAALSVATSAASALPPGLVATTIRAALAAGESLAGVVSASVAELVEGTTTAMLVSKAKMATLLLLTATLLAGAGAWTCRILATPQPPQPQAEPNAPTGKAATRSGTPREDNDATVSGRVVDPDGKPVRGAKLVFIYSSGKESPHKVWAVSAADGRFRFVVPPELLDNSQSKTPWKNVSVVAAAEGYGCAVERLDKAGAADVTLRLVRDDTPIRGRILDLQGRPVAGARIRLANALCVPMKGDLSAWLTALKANKDNPHTVESAHLFWVYIHASDLLFPSVTTGPDGRFEIKGIGRERVASLRIEGPTIATQEIHAMTRPSETIRLPVQKEFPKGQNVTYYGASFDLLVVPSRPIVGIVRDQDTGTPLAGVTIQSHQIGNRFHAGFLNTTTDKDGRYRLEGMPKGDGNEIAATISYWIRKSDGEKWHPINELPYLSAVQTVENKPGLGPVTVDFALTRAVWAEGRITDKNTGEPQRASINYFCFGDNPRAKEIVAQANTYYWSSSREDGVFRIPVLPGHGLIAVRAYDDHYVMGVGADQIKGPRHRQSPDLFFTTPFFCHSGNYHALVEIDPKPGDESITCDATLDPGRTLKGTVLGPDGKPLAGARISGLKDMGYWQDAGAEFTVESLKPKQPRVLQFKHEGKKLSGFLVVRSDEKNPLQVRLKPWGTLTGRIITPLGKPVTSLRVNCQAEEKPEGKAIYVAEFTVYPGKDGRFRFEGLAAGVKYELRVSRANVLVTIASGSPRDLTLDPGETKDLGDLTIKPME